MTLTETIRAARPVLGSAADRWAEALGAALRRRAAYRRTLEELNVLSDRELADLGFSRCDLPRIARDSAA